MSNIPALTWTKMKKENTQNTGPTGYLNNTGGLFSPAKTTYSTNQNTTQTGIRNYLTSAGLDNSKIGWQNGQVTYNGRSLTPDSNQNGVTYASRDKLDSFISDIQNDNGNIGVRSTFQKNGLDTGKLGWRNGQVTYNGTVYTPKINANGVTYGDKQSVYDFLGRALRTEGNDLIQINKYRDPSGLYDVSWNDAAKKVLIGGQEIPYTYIDDSGNAWVTRKAAEEAYKSLAQRNGIENPLDTFARWKEDYADKIYDEYDKLKNSQFSFSPADLERDPVWQAYKAMYEREGRRAYDDALAKGAARTGGNMSSMAQAQANQAWDYYMQKQNDIIPSIAQNAYQRWLADKQTGLDAVSRQNSLAQDILSNETSLRNEAYNKYNSQLEAERSRKNDALSDRLNQMELEKARSDTDYAINKNAYDTSDMFNIPINADTAQRMGISPKADGTYPTANEVYIQKQKEIWNDYQKGIMDYETASELDKYYQQQLIAYSFDNMLLQDRTAASIQQAAQKAAIKASTAKSSSSKSNSSKSSTPTPAALLGGFTW